RSRWPRSSRPLYRIRARTVYPSRTSRSVRWLPTNPPAPVTRTAFPIGGDSLHPPRPRILTTPTGCLRHQTNRTGVLKGSPIYQSPSDSRRHPTGFHRTDNANGAEMPSINAAATKFRRHAEGAAVGRSGQGGLGFGEAPRYAAILI